MGNNNNTFYALIHLLLVLCILRFKAALCIAIQSCISMFVVSDPEKQMCRMGYLNDVGLT